MLYMSHEIYGKYFKRKNEMLKTCVILNLMKFLVSFIFVLKQPSARKMK